MSKPDFDPEQSKTAEVIRDATYAEIDTEDALRELQQMADRRRKDPDLERRYEALRDKLAAQLKAEGPRYYIDASGTKRYAYAQQPEQLDVNEKEFVRLHEEGAMPEVDLDKVMPRGINREAMRWAIAQEKVPAKVIAKTMRYVPGTARVKFVSETDEDQQ